MEFAIWSRDLGHPGLVRQSVVQNTVYDMDIKFGFWVLGHQELGGARWPLRDGWSLPSGAGTWGTRGLARGVGLGNLGLGWAPWRVGQGFLLGVRWLGVGVGHLGQLTRLKLAWRKLGFVGVGVKGVTCSST